MVFKEYLKPYRHWVAEDAIQPLQDVALLTKGWNGWEVSYDNDVERGKRTLRKMEGSVLDAYKEAQGSVMDWSIRFGAELKVDPLMHGGGIHAMEPGGWLQVHLDYAKHPILRVERRLNIIAFLHSSWKKEYGGQLLLCDPMGNVAKEIEPTPGRVIAFETSDESYHGVRRLSKNAPLRLTAAVYLVSDLREGVTRSRALFMPNRNSGMCPKEVM